MKIKFILAGLSFAMLSFTSFRHGDGPVKIKLNSPANNSVISKGDTLHINADIQAANGIHDMIMSISPENMAPIFEDRLHSHDQVLKYSKDYVCNLKLKTRLKVLIRCTDHGGKTIGADSVWVKIK